MPAKDPLANLDKEQLRALIRRGQQSDEDQPLTRENSLKDVGLDPGMEIMPNVQRTQDAPFRPVPAVSPLAQRGKERSLKKGGSIKETGTYKLHKGEEVLNAKAAKRYRRSNGRG